MIDNPRFRGMTLPQAREIEEASRGFRDLSDEQVWALRMVHAHDCTQRSDFARTTADRVRTALSERSLDDAALDHDVRVLVHEVLAPSALAERPAEPDPDDVLGELNDTRIALVRALGGAAVADAPNTSTPDLVRRLAERPAEPEPDPDLVAAFMAEPCAYDMWGEWNPPTRAEAERMAAVAQARNDAAVNADRDRIRSELEGMRNEARRDACCDGTGECGDHRCVADAQRIHALDDALIVLDEESAPLVKPGDPEYVDAEITDDAVVDRDTGGQR